MKKKIGIGITAAVALVLALAMLLAPVATVTAQAISLDHIESIKSEKAASNSSFLIVEVAPSSEDGTIGYYVANQEPTANWPEKAAAISGKEARISYVNSMLASLADRSLLSTGSSTPLTSTGAYTEYYPWEAVPGDATLLTLDESEEVTVSGTFTAQENGEYEPNIRYSLDTENGTALQIVSYFEYATATENGSYYYDLEFTPIEAGAELEDGTAVYRGSLSTGSETDTGEPTITEEIVAGDGSDIDTEPVITESEPETTTEGTTTIVTTVKTTTTKTVEVNTTETIVIPGSETDTETDTETGTDTETEPETTTVVTSVKVTTTTVTETTREITRLDTCAYAGIVGEGLSLDMNEHYYSMSVRAGTFPSATRTDSHCYRAVASGFASGADAAPGSGFFREDIVNYSYVGDGNGSCSFSQSASGSYTGTITSNAVYYTGGYTNNNWFRTGALDCTSSETFPVVVRSYSPSDLAGHLSLLKTADLIVVSSGLSGSGCSLPSDVSTAIESAAQSGTPLMLDSRLTGQLSSTLTAGITSGGVKENVYVFSGSCLSNASFRTSFADTSLYIPESGSYHAVYQEITYENELRSREGVAALTEEVSEATCLRYIINYAGHRVENKKTTLRVLDIEPMTSSAGITKANVKSWLPDNSFSDSQISITTMADAELIGSIEDISECYDLIYIGASTTNTSTYLDTGYVYANIGRTYSVSSYLDGLSGGTTARFSGNDLNTTKQQELLAYANAGYPIIISDSLITEGRAASTLEFTATASGSVTERKHGKNTDYTAHLSARISTQLPAGATISYQWYRGTQLIYGATGSTYDFGVNSNNNGKSYFCAVRVTYAGVTGTAATNAMTLSDQSNDYTITISQNRSNYTYSVAVSPSSSSLAYSWYDAYWNDRYWTEHPNETGTSFSTYKDDIGLDITFPNSHTEEYSFSRNSRFPIYKSYGFSGYIFTDRGGAETGNIQIAGTEGGINTTSVDTASKWYSLLNAIRTKDNVFSAKDAKNQTDKVLQAVNLSQPILTISGDRQYSESNPAGSSLSGRTLTASFTIENPTDATPGATRYYAYFYIDKNADGKFSDDELLSDTAFYNASGSMVASGNLKAGESYHISRLFSSTYTGIIPWKLEVVKVGQAGAHASDVHYAYIQPSSAKTLRVLQICKGSHSVTSYSESGSGSVYRSSIFNSINGVSVSDYPGENNRRIMKIKDDFILDLSILNVDMVKSFSNGTTNDYIDKLIAELLPDDETPTLTELLQQFDMLILGFGDMYGNFDTGSAQAVVDFIDTGKAILFCHDTTSFYNKSSDTNKWGYYFNKVDRNAVGLDRYGVTSSSGSHTTAYLPGSSSTVSNIQGYTSYTMERFKSGEGSPKTTTTVTQVNKGQITTYPFTLRETITTETTHDQYYQLNLTGDDVTVWYCLGGSNYSSIKNDCLNAYYIYNKGNVTYTGAGHTNGFTTDEAKLFINTMIAAYRAAASAPDFTFRRSDDSADQGYLLLTQEETLNEDNSVSLSIAAGQKVYFKVIDTNIANNLSISASFWYMNGDSRVYLTPTIVRTDTQAVSGSNLRSYVLYEFELPEDLLNTLNSSATGTLKLYGQAVTTIGTAAYRSTISTMEMRIAKQLNLS